MRVPRWLGFRRKTLWDWLELLIVPAILVAVTFAWSARQTSSDNSREDRRSQDATLQAYLDQMSDLILHEHLLDRSPVAVRTVARSFTLTTLRRLDRTRKAEVVRFLWEARLLRLDPHHPGPPAVSLVEADLSGVELRNANLEGVDLGDANLTDAVLAGADLSNGYFVEARLRNAQLVHADLLHSWLVAADLRDADLRDAFLDDADLQCADLRGARLAGATFQRANLIGVDLAEADVDGAALDLRGYLSALLEEVRSAYPESDRKYLESQSAFLDSLSPAQLAAFRLSPKKRAEFSQRVRARRPTQGRMLILCS
jgi:uncharacterized protein YjbI with pentapeptide repeats